MIFKVTNMSNQTDFITVQIPREAWESIVALLRAQVLNQAPQPNVVEPEPVPVVEPQPAQVVQQLPLWPDAVEGSFLRNIDIMPNSGFTRANQISREQKIMLLEMKTLNSRTFRLIIDRFGFEKNEKKNLLSSIWRLANPNSVREYSRRSYIRRNRIRHPFLNQHRHPFLNQQNLQQNGNL